MKAVVCTKYGPPEVLKIIEVEKPVPKNNEVLVKVHAAAVTISDCIVRSGKVNFLLWIPMRIFVGFNRPRKSILGLDLAGEVEATGKDIKRLKKVTRFLHLPERILVLMPSTFVCPKTDCVCPQIV